MAYPTQITIASGRTVYEGDPDSDEGITSRQVQVSVTYQMERGDEDLLLVTETKAREVDAAQEAVWRQVRREQTELRMEEMHLPAELAPHPTDEDDPLAGGPGEDQGIEDDGENHGQDPDGDWPEDEPPSYGGNGEDHGGSHGGGSPPPYHPAAAAQGLHPCRTGPGNGTGNGQSVSALAGQGVNGPQARAVTKPQRLALGAQARRLGLSDQALAEIIRERFGKSSYTPRYAVDRLTRAEAESLLRALSEREREAARQGQSAPA